jgi:hypothetical protein
MTFAKKDISDFPLRSPPLDERNIEILSVPGLSVNLQHVGNTLEITATLS